ncbi:MAG: hypothetical protein M9905_03600 [Rhizobiaceae bacterium]|nr:hypothetical protein [Rhizobiaceae bacterium]
MRSLMENMPVHSFRHEFARHARWRREEDRRAVHRNNEREEKERVRERDRTEGQDAFMDFAFGFVIATDEQIAAFTVKLDAYDTATIDALMENEQRLAEVQAELDALLAKAYVLPDGRRVFKTEDGTRVFDENGVEVKDFDPELIEEWRPHWDEYQNPFEAKGDLVKEREELIEFQNLTDEARAEAGEDGITQERLAELEEILARNAPETVQRRLDHEKPVPESDSDPDQQPTVTGITAKLDMPSI